MHLTETHIEHSNDGWKIEFIGDDGDEVIVKVAGDNDLEEIDVVERARAVMVQLTAFGTRGGDTSVNAYDAISNGNFDDDETVVKMRH
jgi:hypothetical protein